jgi:hypothetical protein
MPWMNKIYIHPNCHGEIGYFDSLGKLVFFGYEITNEDSPDVKYVVDKRSPEWRGWRSILAAIEWQHRDKLIQWNRLQSIDKQCTLGVQSVTEEDEACLS